MLGVLTKLLLAVALLAPCGAALATANDSPVPVHAQSVRKPPILWADRVFINAPVAAGWLAARGADYETWAKRHPRAARELARAAR